MPDHYQLLPESSNFSGSLYGVFVILGIILSLRFWLKSAKTDERLILIYFGAFIGAFIGAKLAFILAEGIFYQGEDVLRYWLIGKSVTGALLGGFLGVELIKKLVKYKKPTGDKFALIIPIGIITGRLGCLSHGCCGGIMLDSGKHWSAAPVEIAFNLIIWLVLYLIHRKSMAKYQLFHIYLIAYGVFRFLHEFMRATPKVYQSISGYQLVALVLAIVGTIAYIKRRNSQRYQPTSVIENNE